MVTLNLELESHRSIFKEIGPVRPLLTQIELQLQTKIVPGETLLFLDEIQASPVAMAQLRYFLEELPALHVVAAGSFLELILREEQIPFPVGRVENCFMYPLRFHEFLGAMGYASSREFLESYELKTPVPESIHRTLLDQFRTYVAVGGMPECAAHYAESRSFDPQLYALYSNLQLSFQDDVYKYSSRARAPYLRHVIEHGPRFAGRMITYEGFAGSHFRSREMSDAFSTLEDARLLHRSYSSHSTEPPIERHYRRRPKLIWLDTGLVSFALGAWEPMAKGIELSEVFRGQIAEQVVGQSLLASSALLPREISFWERGKAGSSAEIDFLIQIGAHLVPIEVKSGSSGKLRSLHQFMAESPAPVGVCINSFPPRQEQITTARGRPATLLFLPFYLIERLDDLARHAGV